MVSCQLPPAIFSYLLHPGWLNRECFKFLDDKSLNGVYGVTASSYLMIFSLTCLLEGPFYAWTLRRWSWPKIIWSVVILNLSTHPLVAMGFPQFFALAGFSKGTCYAFSELFAPTVECLILGVLFQVPWKKALGTAFAANLFSWWAGGLLAGFLFPLG